MKKSGYFFISALVFYLTSLTVVKIDSNFNYRWITFIIYCLSLVMVLLSSLDNLNFLKKFKNISLLKKETELFVILVISFISRFIFLKNYPFVAIGDEVRDGGLLSSQIVNGTIKNLYNWGPYQAFGIIIPTVTSFFYLIFGSSVYTYRFPSAIVSILDILIIYLLARKISNKTVAFFAALLMINSYTHLYFSRTEFVVILNSFSTSLIIIVLYLFLLNKNLKNQILLGLFLGFFSGFHASVRTVILMTIFIYLLFIGYQFFFKKERIQTTFGLLLFIISLFIGFGPLLLHTKPAIFFHSSTVPLLNSSNFQKTNLSLKTTSTPISNLLFNYLDSLRTYANNSITNRGNPFLGPIFPQLIFPFFILGLVYSIFFSKSVLLKILSFYSILLPLTNSAITDGLFNGHRLIPIIPISSIIAAFGINLFFGKLKSFLKRKLLIIFFEIILILYILTRGINFFASEAISKEKHFQDFVSMYTIYFLKSYPYNKLCIFVSDANYDYSLLIHNEEKYQYFLPDKEIQWLKNSDILTKEIYITKNCNFKTQYFSKEYCQTYKVFLCPTDDKSPIKIFFEK